MYIITEELKAIQMGMMIAAVTLCRGFGKVAEAGVGRGDWLPLLPWSS